MLLPSLDGKMNGYAIQFYCTWQIVYQKIKPYCTQFSCFRAPIRLYVTRCSIIACFLFKPFISSYFILLNADNQNLWYESKKTRITI